MPTSKKILMIVGDFNEDLEVYFPYQAMLMNNYLIDTVSPGNNKGDFIQTAVHDLDKPHLQSYTEKLGHLFPITADFSKITLKDYDALIIPGGRAAEYQRLNKDILAIIRHFHETNKPIACICHGIQILAEAGILENKKCTTVGFCEPDVRKARGHFIDTGMDGVVVDGKLVTGATWLGNAPWMREFLHILQNEE
ncbi:TPA: DJ-1/PfpI family protein [Legionella pneumophila]|uniref:DJ-1/PfpI family protein n=1 Tax=Legionella pneumophila TaxID=446 RepID=UPI00077C9D52|nr:DJ-1/PfpI family protein [Legionella pneumophila]AMQ28241.1 glutamine amidotransferase [Legionella pneumophila subsp. pneumophila]MBN5930292.1 DJ-1/PfpI family protein [Legionella pneumophila]WII10363.1 DJ-1/PfpI family protein [Legionella pneumophila]WII13517.1 DJ-1/PfpI family protein [Legionella pneumophila]WII16560.1 DJ-1/PfpI family protein [Legionella pneumophila]